MAEVVLDLEHLEEVVDYFLQLDEWSFDCETKGEHRLDPRRNEVFWLQFGSRDRTVVIPFGHPIGKPNGFKRVPRMCSDGKERRFKVTTYSAPPKQMRPGEVFAALKPLFFDNDAVKAGHNIKFDLESVAKYYGAIPDGPYFDTQVAAFLIDENLRTYNLGDCIKRAFDFTYDKSMSVAVETYPFLTAALYCHYDAYYTYLLMQYQKPLLVREKQMREWALAMDLIEPLVHMELTGAPVDHEALVELDRTLDKQLIAMKSDLWSIAGRQWNFASTPQRTQIFYGRKRDGGQGLKPKKFTATGNPSCDEEALTHHVGNPLVDVYLQYQEVSKISGTYVKSYLYGNESKARNKARNNAPPYNPETGRIHTNFKQHGAVTGRFSSSEPNMQNIPRPDTELGQQIRGLFLAPPGEMFIVADWSQIEYRFLAWYSRDKRLMQIFRDGIDFHLAVAGMLLRKDIADVTKVERTTSKNCNFAAVYGAGAAQVASMSGIPVEQAEEFLRLHRKMLPKVYEFNDAVVRTCRKRKPVPYVTTMLGRRRRLPQINWNNNWAAQSYAERQAVNTVIQGSAADLMKMAIVRLYGMIPDDMKLLLTVHDELVMSVPEERVEDGLAVMREAMEGDEIAAFLDPVPLVADIHAVRRWSDAKAA